MQVDGLDTTVINYIDEIKANFEQQIKEIQANYEHQINKLKSDILDYQNKYLEIKEQYDLLVYKRFARSAEQLLADEQQRLLFTEETEQELGPAESINAEAVTEVKSFTRKKGGRKPLSPNLERKEKVIDIPESEKTCACGAILTRIGEETGEKLIIIPPQIYVEKTIRPKYACRACEGTEDEDKPSVRIAPVEPSIIPKSIASPSLLSTIITQKFEIHLPYYRQEKQFEQIGADISRQDMSNWQQQVYKKLSPLFALLKGTVKSGSVMQMDETTVQVIGEEGRDDVQKSRMWLARGGPPGKTVTWYEYHPTRAAYHAKAFLEGFSGYLQTDGYNGYDAAVKDMPGIIPVGCFAHARRKFFEAAKINKKPQSAEEGIEYIRKLYEIEDELRKEKTDQKKTDEQFLIERKAKASVILAEFRPWLEKRKHELPPSTLLGEAVGYTLRQWDKLVTYLESPYLTPDNNACENAIRPFVVGRKNWLFCQSPEGADSSCGMYTLIETAKQHGLVPFKYLMALFEKVPHVIYDDASAPGDWEKLLPWNIFTP
ncbi:MAG: IS66 family transposase [Treponema sp.]|jgi:transposase|nr:IS66 family transposase [Treponema sp.]